jgi:hypothetical protein
LTESNLYVGVRKRILYRSGADSVFQSAGVGT